MRDSLSDGDALAFACGRWCALERGWQATLLGLAIVTALVVVGP